MRVQSRARAKDYSPRLRGAGFGLLLALGGLTVACGDFVEPSAIHYFGPGEEAVTWARWTQLCGHDSHCVLRSGQTLVVDREWVLAGPGCSNDRICIIHEGEPGAKILLPAPLERGSAAFHWGGSGLPDGAGTAQWQYRVRNLIVESYDDTWILDDGIQASFENVWWLQHAGQAVRTSQDSFASVHNFAVLSAGFAGFLAERGSVIVLSDGIIVGTGTFAIDVNGTIPPFGASVVLLRTNVIGKLRARSYGEPSTGVYVFASNPGELDLRGTVRLVTDQ